jgi:hypothetical protein
MRCGTSQCSTLQLRGLQLFAVTSSDRKWPEVTSQVEARYQMYVDIRCGFIIPLCVSRLWFHLNAANLSGQKLKVMLSCAWIIKHQSIRTYLFIYLWLYSPCGPWPLFQFLNLYTVNRISWTGIRPPQGRYLHTEQHKHRIKAHKQSCLEWDSNPRSQSSSGRRWFMA